MTQALAETRRNASVCGCSSMVEQELPKLPASADFCASTEQNTAPNLRFDSNAWLSRAKQMAPSPRQRTEGLTNHRMEVRRG